MERREVTEAEHDFTTLGLGYRFDLDQVWSAKVDSLRNGRRRDHQAAVSRGRVELRLKQGLSSLLENADGERMCTPVRRPGLDHERIGRLAIALSSPDHLALIPAPSETAANDVGQGRLRKRHGSNRIQQLRPSRR